jgi:hypothetical protein
MILVDTSSLEIVKTNPLMASRICGVIVIAGRRFYPLTPAIWAEVYQVMQKACKASTQENQYQSMKPLLRRWMELSEYAKKDFGEDALRDAVKQRMDQRKGKRS